MLNLVVADMQLCNCAFVLENLVLNLVRLFYKLLSYLYLIFDWKRHKLLLEVGEKLLIFFYRLRIVLDMCEHDLHFFDFVEVVHCNIHGKWVSRLIIYIFCLWIMTLSIVYARLSCPFILSMMSLNWRGGLTLEFRRFLVLNIWCIEHIDWQIALYFCRSFRKLQEHLKTLQKHLTLCNLL